MTSSPQSRYLAQPIDPAKPAYGWHVVDRLKSAPNGEREVVFGSVTLHRGTAEACAERHNRAFEAHQRAVEAARG